MEWIIPCNERLYDHRAAFENLEFIDWKQSTNVKIGDTVYIYVGRPTSSILYKCYVKETDISVPSDNDIEYNLTGETFDSTGRYMRLVLICKYPTGLFSKDVILENGLKTVQGPSKMTEQLKEFILSHETESPHLDDEETVETAIMTCEFRRKDGDQEQHNCYISFKLAKHLVKKNLDDSISFELAKSAAKKLDYYDNPEDFVSGKIYYIKKGDPAIGLKIERKDNEWVFTSTKMVKFKEKTSFYADGRKSVEMIR